MQRTNIYLSEVQQAALDARARAEGSNRSSVLREILDRELHIVDTSALDDALVEAAAELADRARLLSEQDPDLDIR